MFTSQVVAFVLLAVAPFAAAHGKVTTAAGNLGGKGTGLGISAATGNSQADVTTFKSATGFGTTNGQAVNAVTALAAMIKITGATIPQVSSASGVVTMTYHQVNADGAGPINCEVSADASATSFTAMKVTTNVPGTNGRSNAANQDFPLVASMPAGTKCTGTVGATTNVCMVRCSNPAGPFGGTVPVQMPAGKKARSVGSLAARAKAILAL